MQQTDGVTSAVPEFELSGPAASPSALLRTVWQHRRLVVVLASKDFYVRYRRTRLGMLWAIALPVTQALVLAAVFSHLVPGVSGRTGTGGVPYALFVFAGMVPWAFFSTAFTAGGTSLVDGASLAQRIYFPRMVLPLVAVTTALFPFAATTLVLLVMAVVLGPGLSAATLWLVPGAVLATLLAATLSVLVSAAQVYLRDLRFAVSAAMTVLFYLTPVIYPVARVPENLQHLVTALPMAGCVELFRAGFGAEDAHWGRAVLATVCWVLVAGAGGLLLHSRRDRVLTDLL